MISDIGQPFYDWLIKFSPLSNLLKSEDENGQPIWNIHRDRAPQYDEMVMECIKEGSSVTDFDVPDFLVFRIDDEIYADCVDGACEKPEQILLSVQLVADCLEGALKLKEQFKNAVSKLANGCSDDLCDRILSHEMCGIWVADASVTGVSEDHQPITRATDFGLQTFDFSMNIVPDWSK